MREQLQKQPVGQEYLNQTINQTMHIALVGVRPGDKILLKEYFKKLLDLKVAIEWVLISYPNVDLFLIGKEFRDSAVVTKLLADQEHKPVLYVSNQGGAGEITADSLTLPLESLDKLDKWLLDSVAILGASSAGSINSAASNDADLPLSQATDDNAEQEKADSINASSDVNDTTRSSSTATAATPDTATDLKTSNNDHEQKHEQNGAQTSPLSIQQASYYIKNDIEDYQGLTALADQIQQKQRGLFQITSNQHPWAIVEPSHGRLWLNEASIAPEIPKTLSLDWQLIPYDGAVPAHEEAYDLVQYLWQCAWRQADLLTPLLGHQFSYQLKYWIKPVLADASTNNSGRVSLDKQDRQHLLAVMNALELAPRDIRYLSELTATSTDYIQKLVASLWFVGSIQALAHTDTQAVADTNDTNSSEHIQSVATDVDVAAQQEKQGFLSRLRRKLGL